MKPRRIKGVRDENLCTSFKANQEARGMNGHEDIYPGGGLNLAKAAARHSQEISIETPLRLRTWIFRTRSLGSQRKSINALAVCTAANSAASREGKIPFTYPVLDSVLGLPDSTIEY